MFYQDISSADPEKQTKAIGPLSLMNPDLASNEQLVKGICYTDPRPGKIEKLITN